ncbi:asparaginase [Mariniflexile ostreae]|uniref:Asparaginase n=1 Tax=Mariniflexile ostreae TaxID=1520892 RepID=A0ABV5F998_9FLAO
MSKPNILLIYTGGTIGMVKDSKTGSLAVFDFENLLEHIPELKLLDCSIDTLSFEAPIDSSNMNPKYWVQIAEIIESNYNGFDGFVVLHGSDTMSYTASALSFMLENLAKPVIFTGSQLPIGDFRTDAKENLMTAVQIAALHHKGNPIIKEVCLYFEYKLYRGNRTSKVNAEHFQAFSSPNYPDLAESGVRLKINHQHLFKPDLDKPLRVFKNMDAHVGIVKLFPGISELFLRSVFNTPNLKGIILETYGSGNCSTEIWMTNLLKETIEKGVFIINVTQCLGGSVQMGDYKTSEHLKKCGVISGKDLTTEAAITKLMHLLGNNIIGNSFKTKYETPMRGEMI